MQSLTIRLVKLPGHFVYVPSCTMLSLSFLSIALTSFVLCTTATPLVPRSQLISLPIAKVINTTGTTNIIKKDRARISLFRQDTADDAVVNDPVTNQGVTYTAPVC